MFISQCFLLGELQSVRHFPFYSNGLNFFREKLNILFQDHKIRNIKNELIHTNKDQISKTKKSISENIKRKMDLIVWEWGTNVRGK